MSVTDHYERRIHGRRQTAITAAVGFFLAALIPLASLLVFRRSHRVPWPPSPTFPRFVTLSLESALFIAAVSIALYLVSRLAPAWNNAVAWREFRAFATTQVTVAAVFGASVSISFNVFYRPWERWNAVRTIVSNPPKWRLVAAVAAIEGRLDGRLERDLADGLADPSPGVQICAAYAFAARGDRTYLKCILDITLTLPLSRPDAQAPSMSNNVASQGDALLLLGNLLPSDYPTLESYRRATAVRPGDSVQDGQGTYSPKP